LRFDVDGVVADVAGSAASVSGLEWAPTSAERRRVRAFLGESMLSAWTPSMSDDEGTAEIIDASPFAPP
jgi:hypothetical protein